MTAIRRQEYDQHRAHVQCQLQTPDRAVGYRLEHVGTLIFDVDLHRAHRLRLIDLRLDYLGDQQSAGADIIDAHSKLPASNPIEARAPSTPPAIVAKPPIITAFSSEVVMVLI